MLGVRRSSVSVVAGILQRAGLINYPRGHIRIEDVEGLQEAACECYKTVQAHSDRLLGPKAETHPPLDYSRLPLYVRNRTQGSSLSQ